MSWGIFKKDSISESYKKMKAEELKGKQHKLDVDKDGKIEGEDLAKLRSTKKEEVEVTAESSNPHATNDRVYSTPTGTVHRAKPGAYGGYKKDKEEVKLKSPKALDKMDKALTKEETEEQVDEAMQKSDVPAYLRKQKGEKPLTVADVKGPRKDSISHKDNLAKLRNEEVEQLDELSPGALKNYIKGAKSDKKFHADTQNTAMRKNDHMMASDSAEKVAKRKEGIKAAKAKLNKEDLDIFSESEIDTLINEVLKASDDAGKWISDFIKSDDPRFAGDSKEQRKKRALAAYYAAQKKESTDYDSFVELDEETIYESTVDYHNRMANAHHAHMRAHTTEDENRRPGSDHFHAAEAHESASEAHAHAAKTLKKHGADSSEYKSAASKAKEATSSAKETSSTLKFKHAAKPEAIKEASEKDLVKTGSKEIKHANIKDKEDDKDDFGPTAQGEKDFLDKLSVQVTDDPAGDYKSGADKLAVSSKPVGKGAGKYDGKNKTGVKESAGEDESEEDEDEYENGKSKDESAKAKGKKTYSSFKEEMKCKKG